MGLPSCIRSVVDRNVVMPVLEPYLLNTMRTQQSKPVVFLYVTRTWPTVAVVWKEMTFILSPIDGVG